MLNPQTIPTNACPCSCCADFWERSRCVADTRWACNCGDVPEDERCTCELCRYMVQAGRASLAAMRATLAEQRLQRVRAVLDPLGAVRADVSEADIAERLRLTTIDYEHRLQALTREIAVFREALERIAKHDGGRWATDADDWPTERQETPQKIARAALHPPSPTPEG